MQKNKLWFLSLALFLGACSTTTTQEKPETDTAATTTEAIVDSSDQEENVHVSVKVIVEGEEISELTKELDAEPGDSLMDVMTENYEIGETDGFLESIEGYEQSADDDQWWMFQVNGEDGEVGAADYEVLEDDEITWELTQF